MKRLLFFVAAVLFAAACGKGDEALAADASQNPAKPGGAAQPVVTTRPVTGIEATKVHAGGRVAGVDVGAIAQAGVQCMAWSDDTAPSDEAWSGAGEVVVEAPATEWLLPIWGLEPATQYAVRAFVVMTDATSYYGDAVIFNTLPYDPGSEPDPEPDPEPEPDPTLTVAQLRALYAAGADVADRRVRGYVALSIPADCLTESFPAATVVLYDNTGEKASALFFAGEGIGAAALQPGDCVEIALAGVAGSDRNDLYVVADAADVRKVDGGHALVPVWATPTLLNASPDDYAASPVRVGRLYAERPGELFSVADNFFTDGEGRLAVYAAATSTVGLLTQNAATGTLCGICTCADGQLRVVPVTEADVADFTGEGGIAEGEPAVELLHGEYCEFPPQGGERIVECRVTAPAGMRLWADLRNVDESRFSVEITGSSVRLIARPNLTGEAVDYANCYLYLAETKEGQRYDPQTIRIAQLGNVYESIPALITANGGEYSSVHEAVVDGVATQAMKLGSGNYTGHYLSDPTGAVGDHVLTFYAVGWRESDHDAATLYLRAVGGGTLSATAIPLTINDGATGMAPFILSVGDESRYEVKLRNWTPGSAVEFSTSPTFDKQKDKKTGRALLFGIQID